MTRRITVLGVAFVALAALLALALMNQPSPRRLTRAAPVAATAYGKLVIGHLNVNVSISKHGFNLSTPEPGGGGGTGAPDFKPLSLTKPINASSPVLMRSVANGQHFPTAVLTVYKSNATKTLVRYRLANASLGSLQQNGNKENLTLRYDQIQMTAGGVSVCWDVVQNASC
jgi:hypothetical protein